MLKLQSMRTKVQAVPVRESAEALTGMLFTPPLVN